MLYLWKLERIVQQRPTYDVMNGCVVRSSTEDAARRFAKSQAGDEGEDVWIEPTRSTCVRIGVSDDQEHPSVVLIDFNAG